MAAPPRPQSPPKPAPAPPPQTAPKPRLAPGPAPVVWIAGLAGVVVILLLFLGLVI